MSGHGQIDDGFGNVWLLCKPGCGLQIVRPGKVQCECEYREPVEDLYRELPNNGCG